MSESMADRLRRLEELVKELPRREAPPSPLGTTAMLEARLNALDGLVQALTDRLRNTPPIGTIILVAADQAPPAGYLLCDGAEYDVETERPDLRPLAQVLGHTWGGTGASRFRVPDLRGVFPRFHDKGRGVDPERRLGVEQPWATAMPRKALSVGASGSHTHALKGSGAHKHSFSTFDFKRDEGKRGDYWHLLLNPRVAPVGGDGSHTHQVEGAGAHEHPLSGGDGETRPVNHALVGYVRY